jgi:predicted DNA binding CopG/RHH family protein
MKRAKPKKLPRFKSEKQEREFWLKHDAADYFDLSRAQPAIFPSLKPSTKSISIRLPQGLLAQLKVLANKKDVPYQSLLKIFLAERVEKEAQKA